MASLGLDVGGSKCRFAWWPDGAGPGGDAPAAQPAVDGVPATVRAMADAIGVARQHLPGEAPDAVVCALAGAGDPGVQDAVQRGLGEVVRDVRVAVVGDVLAAAAAALRCGPGLLLWSGTGSFCVARGDDGRLVRGGGRGFAFGDEGSGYDLVRRAIVAVLRAVDGRGRDTVLVETLTRAFGAPSPARLGAVAQRLSPKEVAARLPVVLDAFAGDDQVAADVLVQGAHQLVQLAEATARRAGLEPGPGLAVTFGGGVLEGADVVRDGLLRLLQAAFGGELVERPLPPHAAASGAAWLAHGWHHGEAPQHEWVERVAL